MRIPGGFGPRSAAVLSCLKLQEFQVAEAIHCPSCSTRYRLRPERLRPVHRRARCFSCGGVFPVGDVVQRLLAPDLDLPEITTLQMEDVPPGTLTLGDLEGAESEILEKTLVDLPGTLPEATPERAQAAPAPFPPEITDTTLSGYTSARDAIEKLFGGTPAQPAGLKAQDPDTMDVEATLSALEATLGAAPVAPPTGDDEPTGPGSAPEPDPFEPSLHGAASTTTVRLTQADLMAALQAAPASAPAPSTVALRASDLLPPTEAPRHEAASPFAATPAAGDAGAELLRLRIGEEIYAGLTMAQLIGWVEEGRVLESHLVARQHSENWLEAHKVPGLRPVFERLRRERSGGAPALDTPLMDIAPKKSLFGGLFGKNA